MRPALALTTRRVTDSNLPIGASRIGGSPDLPTDFVWPTYEDGRPLTFLAQLNLAEVAAAGSPIPTLPGSGQLLLFSAWGWVQPDDSSPHVPDESHIHGPQAGWTRVSYLPDVGLSRRKAPGGTPRFKPATIAFASRLSLPGTTEELDLLELGWAEATVETYLELTANFNSAREWMLSRRQHRTPPRHQLGGYPRFEQGYPSVLQGSGLRMLLQLGADPLTNMAWGDGGDLIFYCDETQLLAGRIERLWGIHQSH